MPEDKLIKTVIIARSGIYKYRAEELPNLGLSINDAPEKKDFYLVYRPALVLARDKDKFKMLTLTNGHPDDLVDSQNFKDLAIGFTGEVIDIEWNKEQEEVVLKTKISLVDKQALENYFTGLDEVSPGYLANFIWQKSKTSKGEDYDIVMTEVTNGNHLAMTPKARGGSIACIIDSEGGNMTIKKFMSNLWREIRKIRTGVKDSDNQFRTICNDIASKKDSLKDEELKSKVEELKTMSSDLPESDNKNILSRYLEDFGIIKEKDEESAKLASGKIADLYEKLDSESQGENIMGKTKDVDNTSEGKTESKEELEKTTDTSPEEAFIEGLEQLFMKYHESKTGKGEGEDEEEEKEKEEKPENLEDEEEENKTEEIEKKEPGKKVSDKKAKDEEPEEKKKEETKKSVGDSMSNITIDSSSEGKEGLGDFFKNKIKGGKK